MPGPSPNDLEFDLRENAPEEASQLNDQQSTHSDTNVSPTGMTPHEQIWWSMSFEELYQHAKRKGFAKTKHGSRHNGRVKIIHWLCNQEDITPYSAPTITPTVDAESQRFVTSTGAISHPEAILRTSDPALQHQIAKAEEKYLQWTAADLTALAMERSYQLLKDSQGKLPSKSKKAMSNWLASWDVLKSPREKKWWTGDGIDLNNKAKALGYRGSSKKYDVIVWLRTVPEDAELESAVVAEPTPVNKFKSSNFVAEDGPPPLSKRRAKGSKRDGLDLSTDLVTEDLFAAGGTLARERRRQEKQRKDEARAERSGPEVQELSNEEKYGKLAEAAGISVKKYMRKLERGDIEFKEDGTPVVIHKKDKKKPQETEAMEVAPVVPERQKTVKKRKRDDEGTMNGEKKKKKKIKRRVICFTPFTEPFTEEDLVIEL